VQYVQKYNECDLSLLQSNNAVKTNGRNPDTSFPNPRNAQLRTDFVVIVLQNIPDAKAKTSVFGQMHGIYL
jgi:hypothetical protein